MKPRRQQTPISIRSDKAAARLALLTRSGKSQAEVIEEALEALPTPINDDEDQTAFLKEIREIVERAKAYGNIPTMAEFDAATYDERGLLR